jgi:formylglycine-generating enzyme required for sulfatase activity
MSTLYDAFISYGRDDSKAFAIQLHNILSEYGFQIYIDKEYIPLAINDGIEKSHNFIFVISPSSVNTEYCLKELEYADQLNKRIIPLRHVKLDKNKDIMPGALRKLNLLDFHENKFEKTLPVLLEALSRQREYVEQHTRILMDALKWQRRNYDSQLLLHGDDLESAEIWLQNVQEQQTHQPVEIQRCFIAQSRIAKRDFKSAQFKKRLGQLLISGLIIGVVGLTWYAWKQTELAQKAKKEVEVQAQLLQKTQQQVKDFEELVRQKGIQLEVCQPDQQQLKSCQQRLAQLEKPAEITGKIFQDTLADGTKGPEMVWIPAGTFPMGNIQDKGFPNEKPVHKVSIEQFAMGRYEVTFDEYDKFAEATGRKKPDDEGWGRGYRPVINVSWHDATAYTEWLSKQTGKPYRLPSEAQWEYAARANTVTSRYWGNNPDEACDYANVHDKTSKGKDAKWTYHKCTDGYEKTAPVDSSFKPNAFGLFNMLGNVWEWNADLWHENYKNAPDDGKVWDYGNQVSTHRVLRGCSFYSKVKYCRAATRLKSKGLTKKDSWGFRVVSVARIF